MKNTGSNYEVLLVSLTKGFRNMLVRLLVLCAQLISVSLDYTKRT